MKKIKWLLQIMIIVSILTIIACKRFKIDNYSVLKVLYKENINGWIKECKYTGETVYIAYSSGYNPIMVYDYDGDYLGACGPYVRGNAMCNNIEDCEIIYRSASIGDPIDKYGLGK